MIRYLKQNLIWTEGRYILFVIIILLPFVLLDFKLFMLPIFLFIIGFYFFRNPYRGIDNIKDIDNSIISPSDGKIVDVSFISNSSQKISIFLSPLNVHVNWIPMSGLIKSVSYRSGKFKPAFVPKSSDLNECNDIVIVNNRGREIIVRQIAGMLARRISCWVKPLDEVLIGQKYGIIHFSSRVDVILPKAFNISVEIGQKVVGGKTILGKWTC